MKRFILNSFILAFFAVLLGCKGTQYSFQAFTFPDYVPAHESGWIYRGKINVITSESGSMFRKGDKKVQILIFDANENKLLKDTFSFSAVSALKANVTWKDIGDLKIEIVEYGNSDIADDYSRSLAQTGERVVSTYFYQLDDKGKKYFLRKQTRSESNKR